MLADSENADSRRLLDEASCFSILPAGAGKTELLARCTSQNQDATRRTLLLTHTNAGVDVLRRRIVQVGGTLETTHVTTIAAWCERLCRTYPLLAGWRLPAEGVEARDYAAIYAGAQAVLSAPSIQRMLSTSWSVVLVDEYQDCSKGQHSVVGTLSQSVRTVVVGDHLQAIFRFEGDSVDWDEDVAASWPQVQLSTAPRRWERGNRRLGDQLAMVRELLIADQPLDLDDFSEIRWNRQTPANTVARSKAVGGRTGSCIVIVRYPAQTVALAKRCGGLFGSLEKLATNDLIAFARRVDDSGDPCVAIQALFDLASKCMAKLPAVFGDRGSKLASGSDVSYQPGSKLGAVTSAAILYRTSNEVGDLARTAAQIRQVDGVVVARKELWDDLEIALTVAARRNQPITDAATQLRERTRRQGRRPARRVIGTTLLAKGLEYDHVVVTDADLLDRENLYVALTRATTSLEVLSASKILHPGASR